MDVIGISETSENAVNSFVANIELDGYELFHTPTNSAKGGTAIYVNKNVDAFERTDIKALTDL